MERFFVRVSALALVYDVFIPEKAAGFQRAEDINVSAFYSTGDVEVFDTNQPFAMMLLRIEIAADGGDQGTKMEGAGGGGGETASI